jgi:hypothetical protein
MIPLVAMGWIHLVFMLVLLNIHEICLKLKSGCRIIQKFPTLGVLGWQAASAPVILCSMSPVVLWGL